MEPRWKGKGFKAKALAEPISKIVSQLRSSLIQSDAHGLLVGCSVLIAAEAEQIDLLDRACFGNHNTTAEKDKEWFQLGLEEAFYLCYSLKCLTIVSDDHCPKNDVELWQCMISKKSAFPDFYKAYAHLRMKNWVVKSGSTYGVDFVAYRHHPSLVHSEYAVLVLSEGEDEVNGRLRLWSDLHCTTRLSGSVVKTLLVLKINKNGNGAASSSSLEKYTVIERTITRWRPEQCRENPMIDEKITKQREALGKAATLKTKFITKQDVKLKKGVVGIASSLIVVSVSLTLVLISIMVSRRFCLN
ncbi:tRNA-splicing endonuclease subunit Sen2-1-like [Juglans microcarpa x Juglans regia]|uniref:tRNA-splicing endonuclease subunit Sen2-1-like n=1 Tax=Juglans microcarpa x Juglans regia TaxID=2249226 RepID=UPI001B7DBD0B|nr:tRNA-splicing endonuclease subunit Sen2-1-like [Juglans microcarpa x Juglans regia]XP_040994478.1 tRNA-splicing endonuclease subunit Sen2-1-like [Juglans microcarpa x Juglans regia]XP_040994479.1 tRNA-splicing endonuclease subunit Sen2-1-like [Juglans microcarpa x Juglans regia]XP_040994480.1 tRNA-splicing endonuclease subunit Sen2-1-like [Juglans microcarpa x Juglans regia]XP_040994481.1 tRNA-splicing endonuclease subunit Sen2-1-like [Juglans microcarpa x Juglans regia]XP_040994482.1 tRNA-